MADLPKVISEGEITLGSLTMKVFMLDNGQRIISEQGIIDFMNWLQKGEIENVPQDKINEFVKMIKG